MKKMGILSIEYCFITLIATYAVGHILLRQFPDGEALGATVLFLLMNLVPMITSCIFSILTRECANVWDFFKNVFFRKENIVIYFMVIAIP